MNVFISLPLFLLVSVSGQEDIGPAREARDAGCDPDQHRCNSTGRCIYGWHKCDGWPGCEDGSDEDKSMCATHTCSTGQHRCLSTNICLNHYSICDLYSNCDDNSDEDEDMCASRSCESSEYRCRTGQCVYYLFVCDGFENCADDSDEVEDGGCAANATNKKYDTKTTLRLFTKGDISTTLKQTNATENLTDENMTTPGLSDVDTTVVNTTSDYEATSPNSSDTQTNNLTTTRQTHDTKQANGTEQNTDATATALWRSDVGTTKTNSAASTNLAQCVLNYICLLFMIV